MSVRVRCRAWAAYVIIGSIASVGKRGAELQDLTPSCVVQPPEAYERPRLLLGFAVSHARCAIDCRAPCPGI